MPPAWEPPHHSPTMANNKWAEFSNPQIGPDLQLRHKLYQLGDWEHAYFGKFEITPELHAEIVANFSADEPQNLNYNHVNDAISAGLIIEVEADTDADGWAWGTSLLTDASRHRLIPPWMNYRPRLRRKSLENLWIHLPHVTTLRLRPCL